jgi:hypothetical protein
MHNVLKIKKRRWMCSKSCLSKLCSIGQALLMCLNFLLCLNFWPFVLLLAFSEAFLCIHLVYLGCAPLCFSMNYYLSKT